MPGKVLSLIEKTLHPDGYYIISSSTSGAEPPKPSHLKLWIHKGLIIGHEQREKLIREEQAAKSKEEIPTPGFVLLVDEESVVEPKTSAAAVIEDSSLSTFESKLSATKRKMHDSYQQLANAKKQRRIQLIDPRDLPPSQSSSKGKTNIAARKKVIITTNKKTGNNSLFFDGGRRSKPMSIFRSGWL